MEITQGDLEGAERIRVRFPREAEGLTVAEIAAAWREYSWARGQTWIEGTGNDEVDRVLGPVLEAKEWAEYQRLKIRFGGK